MKKGQQMIWLVALAVTLGSVGVGYAAWSDTLRVDSTVTTGTQAYAFCQNSTYRAYWCDGGEKTPAAVTAEPQKGGDTVGLTVTDALQAQMLRTQSGYLRLESPIEPGDGNTLKASENPPEITAAPDGTAQAQAIPEAVTVCGVSCGEKALSAVSCPPLTFDVWRGTETVEGQLCAVVLLRPRQGAAPEKLALQLPWELLPAAGQDAVGRGKAVTADVRVRYELTVTCGVGQFNEPRGEGDLS